MKKQFVLRMMALLMAMLMVLAAFAGCKSKKNKDDDDDVDTSAQAVFRNALVGFVTDIGEIPALKSWLNMYQHGSLEAKAEIDAGKIAASMGETGVSGSIDAGYKFYFSNTGILMENVYMDIKSPLDNIDVSISGDVYFSPDYIYVKNDNILGGTIGLIPGEMGNAFESSSWKDEIPAEYVELIKQVLEMYDGGMADMMADVSDDIKPIVDRYVEVVSDSLEKNAKFVEETKTVTVGGENVESRVVTLVIDKDAVVGFIKDLYNAVKGDADLRALVVEYGDLMGDYLDMSGAQIGMEYDNLLAMLGESMDSLEAEIPEFAVMVSVTTPTDASTLRRLEVSYRDGDASSEAESLFALDLGKNGIKNTNRVSLEVMGLTVATYEIVKNDESGFKASLVAIIEGSSVTLFTIDINKNAGTYNLSVPELNFAMGGTFKTEGDKTTVVFNSITVEGETINQGFSLTFVIDENAEMPKVVDKNDVTNAFELNKDDIADIVNRFENVFGDLFKSDSSTPPENSYN